MVGLVLTAICRARICVFLLIVFRSRSSRHMSSLFVLTVICCAQAGVRFVGVVCFCVTMFGVCTAFFSKTSLLFRASMLLCVSDDRCHPALFSAALLLLCWLVTALLSSHRKPPSFFGVDCNSLLAVLCSLCWFLLFSMSHESRLHMHSWIGLLHLSRSFAVVLTVILCGRLCCCFL